MNIIFKTAIILSGLLLASCGGSDSSTSNTTSTNSSNSGSNTAASNPACTVAGNNVFVTNNSSCDYNGNTATCTNGSISYMGLNAGTSITVNGITFSCQ